MSFKEFLNNSPKNYLALLLLLSFVAGAAGGAIPAYFGKNFVLSAQNSSPEKVVEKQSYVEESQSISAIKKVSPAVVSIVATRDLKVYKNNPTSYFDPFGNDSFGNLPGLRFQIPNSQSQPNQQLQEGRDYEVRQQKIGGGTGFVVTAEGLVLTNRHVVSETSLEYTVITNDGTEYDAEVVSIDPLNDLAVVQMVKKGELSKKKEERVKLAGLSVVEFGDSGSLEVGQKVLAIGYALGEYENTVTSGIISGKNRSITAGGLATGSENLSGLLQTDTAINPGNSGGPLINLEGQVIGVNVAIDTTGSSIGFAIPVNEVKPVMDSIQKYGRIVRPTLGVRHILLNAARAKQLEIKVDHGALLVGDEANGEFAVIPGSPADKAGLKIRDVILSIDGKNISEDYSLQDAIRGHQPGDEVTLKVWRSGQEMDIKVKLDQTKEEASLPKTNV